MSAGRSVKSKSQDWGTPPKYARAVHSFFSHQLALDPCSNEWSLIEARTKFALPEKDGLNEDWNFSTIFVNPPYGADYQAGTTIKHWLKKCAHANEVYGAELLALIPVAPNTSHWKNYVFTKASSICFLYDTRLRFLEQGKDSGKGAPMACSMVYWGQRLDDFYNKFIEFGAVVDISNLINQPIANKRSSAMLPF